MCNTFHAFHVTKYEQVFMNSAFSDLVITKLKSQKMRCQFAFFDTEFTDAFNFDARITVPSLEK